MVYPPNRLPFEGLTTIDERVDYVHNQLVSIQLGVNQLSEKEGIPAMNQVAREVVLRETFQPLTGARVWKPSPLTGRIVQVIRHFPNGCDSLVDVAFGHGDIWVLPNDVDTFIALNDTTPVVTVSEEVHQGERLWMIVRNTDGVNAHTISLSIIVGGVL